MQSNNSRPSFFDELDEKANSAQTKSRRTKNRNSARDKNEKKRTVQSLDKDAVARVLLLLERMSIIYPNEPSLVKAGTLKYLNQQLRLQIDRELTRATLPNRWREAGRLVQLLYVQQAMEVERSCYFFSLRFSDKIIKGLERREREGDKSLNSLIQERFTKLFKNFSEDEVPMYWFIPERPVDSETGEIKILHIHGVVASNLPYQEIGTKLKAVGGRTTDSFRGYQLDLQTIYCGEGVCRYNLKSLAETMITTDGELLTIAAECKPLGKKLYEGLREVAKRALNESKATDQHNAKSKLLRKEDE